MTDTLADLIDAVIHERAPLRRTLGPTYAPTRTQTPLVPGGVPEPQGYAPLIDVTRALPRLTAADIERFRRERETVGPQGNAHDVYAGAMAVPDPEGMSQLERTGSNFAEMTGLPQLKRGIQHTANSLAWRDDPQRSADEAGAALPELAMGGLGMLGLMSGGGEGTMARLPARRLPTVADPIEVLRDSDGNHFILNGRHRVAEAVARGNPTIRAQVVSEPSAEPVTRLPVNPTRELGPNAMPIAAPQPFRQSFVGGTTDLNEAAAMRPNNVNGPETQIYVRHEGRLTRVAPTQGATLRSTLNAGVNPRALRQMREAQSPNRDVNAEPVQTGTEARTPARSGVVSEPIGMRINEPNLRVYEQWLDSEHLAVFRVQRKGIGPYEIDWDIQGPNANYRADASPRAQRALARPALEFVQKALAHETQSRGLSAYTFEPTSESRARAYQTMLERAGGVAIKIPFTNRTVAVANPLSQHPRAVGNLVEGRPPRPTANTPTQGAASSRIVELTPTLHELHFRGGALSFVPSRNVWTISRADMPEVLRGQGRGVAMYEDLIRRAREAGVNTIKSDDTVSESAARVWSSLEQRGYAVRRTPTKTGSRYTYTLDTRRLPDAAPNGGALPPLGAAGLAALSQRPPRRRTDRPPAHIAHRRTTPPPGGLLVLGGYSGP